MNGTWSTSVVRILVDFYVLLLSFETQPCLSPTLVIKSTISQFHSPTFPWRSLPLNIYLNILSQMALCNPFIITHFVNLFVSLFHWFQLVGYFWSMNKFSQHYVVCRTTILHSQSHLQPARALIIGISLVILSNLTFTLFLKALVYGHDFT